MIISFSGLDGVGKTTQVDLLFKYLKENKKNVKKISIQKGSTTNLIHFSKTKSRKLINTQARNPVLHNLLGAIRQMNLLVDLILFKIFLLLNKKKIILCDRYFYDLLVHLKYLKLSNPLFERIYLSWIPKPDIAFLFDGNPKNIFNRKPEYNLDYYIKKRAFYLSIPKLHLIKEGSIESIQHSIKMTIGGVINV